MGYCLLENKLKKQSCDPLFSLVYFSVWTNVLSWLASHAYSRIHQLALLD